jgi:acyl-coenzyme A synthetase/AMP-(fatty) acid ligase
MNNLINFKQIIEEGITIRSSGTSGEPKDFFQSPKKLQSANRVALDAQQITKDSRVYTCCKTSHAGGLLAQTLPALSIGAHVDIVTFNAWEFVRNIKNYTHTHITPLHAKAIMLTKGYKDLDLSGIWITCGADPVTWDIIESFVEHGATLMVNWGMSEIGPIAINTVFDSLDKVARYKNVAPDNSTILGDIAWCEYRIFDKELYVKGSISLFDDWYATKDSVVSVDNILFYKGRINAEVDLCSPKKG